MDVESNSQAVAVTGYASSEARFQSMAEQLSLHQDGTPESCLLVGTTHEMQHKVMDDTHLRRLRFQVTTASVKVGVIRQKH